MDVIRCDELNYLVWKWRPAGQEVNSTKKEHAIRFGSSLFVKAGEMAVFVYRKQGEQVMDYIPGPFSGGLKTANLPVLINLLGAAYGGDSPFQAEIYFFNLQQNNQIRFAVPYFDVADPRFVDMTVPMAVHGQLTFNLTDVRQFIHLNRLVDFSLDALREQITGMVRQFVKNFVTNYPIEQGISVLQIERRILEISNLMQQQLAPQLANDFGVNLKRLDLASIEIDKESEDYAQFIHATKEQQMIQAEQVGRRAQIETDIYAEGGHLGVQSQHIQAHTINKQAEIMAAAANNLGQMGQMNAEAGGGGMNPIGMMMGMGMAAGMGQQMMGMMQNGMQQMNQAMQQPVQQPAQPQPAQPETPEQNPEAEKEA